jgi:hypothetical protein
MINLSRDCEKSLFNNNNKQIYMISENGQTTGIGEGLQKSACNLLNKIFAPLIKYKQ